MKYILFILLLVGSAVAQENPWDTVELYPLRQPSYGLSGYVWSPGMPAPVQGSVHIADGRIESLSIRKHDGLPTGGLILPGLIDLHDHLAFGYCSRFSGQLWPSTQTFKNRYEWQDLAATFHEKHLELFKPVASLFYLYGEVREIVGGTTATACYVEKPAHGLLSRNLDGASSEHGLPLSLESSTFFFELNPMREEPPRFVIRPDALERLSRSDVYFVHLAEGRRDDPLTRLEFESFLEWAEKNPTLTPKIVLIHLVGLQDGDFARLRRVGIDKAVWSPSSNMALYGETMRVSTALAEGFTICLGTDWSPSGGDSLFDELRLAKRLEKDGVVREIEPSVLNDMLLKTPGTFLEDRLGVIYPGSQASLTVIPWKGDLESSLESADVDTMLLTIVDGQPLFGRTDLMQQLLKKGTPSPVRPTLYTYGFDLDAVYGEILKLIPDAVPPEALGEPFYPR